MAAPCIENECGYYDTVATSIAADVPEFYQSAKVDEFIAKCARYRKFGRVLSEIDCPAVVEAEGAL